MTVYDSSEEERSLLFSDNDPDSSQAGDTNNHIMSDDIDNDVLQWEDFMIDYWSRNNHNTNSSDDEQQLDITENAEMIIMMEDTDMAPHPLEPELDNISHLIGNHFFNYPTKQHDMNIIDTVDSTAVVNCDDRATLIERVLCEAGLQSTLQMAKLNSTAAVTDNHSKFHRQNVQKKQQQQQQQLLQEEFVIDMSHVPMTSSGATAGSGSKSKRKKRTKANAAGSNAIAGGGVGSSSAQINNQKEVSSPGTRSESSRDTNCPQSTLAMMHPPASSPQQQQQQQQEESLEESLFVMAKRLSPGNDDDHILSQQQQRRGSDKQHQPSQQQQHRRQHSATSSTTTSDTKLKLNSIKSIPTTLPPPPPPQHPSDSPLPNPNLIHQMGPIQTRTSLRSLLMKKWHPSWWMHYDSHSILIFRSKDHLDDWVQNPYHGRRERAYLVKLRVDFGDVVGASGAGGVSGAHLINSSSNSESGSPVRNSNTTKESGNILGHRILPIKRKSYNKNEPEMYQFKLERWTNMGVSVLAAFASEEEKEVELLYETIGRIMESCPFGGLHDIEHMLQH